MKHHKIIASNGLDLKNLRLILNLPKLFNTLIIDELKKAIASIAIEVTGGTNASVLLLDNKTDELLFDVATGEKGSDLKIVRMPKDAGIAGQVLSENKPIMKNQVTDKTNWNVIIEATSEIETKNIIAIPLTTINGSVGVLEVINKPVDFVKSDVDMLQLVGEYMAVAIEKAIIHKQQQNLNDKLERRNWKLLETQSELSNINAKTAAAYAELVCILLNISELNDPETANHMIRVGELSALLGKHYGLNDKQIKTLRLAAQLHDIGKTGLPDKILKKPGAYTNGERAEMQKHTSLGHKTLKGSTNEILKAAAIIALQHHERIDGEGYPEGLKGEEIHVFARIASLIDVFDALISERVYKGAFSIEKALALIKKQRGKQFDARLVDIFLNNLDEIFEIVKKYQDDSEFSC